MLRTPLEAHARQTHSVCTSFSSFSSRIARLLACAGCLLAALLPTSAQAFRLIEFEAQQASPDTSFTNVVWAADERIFSGYDVNPISLAADAAVYISTGPPGAPLVRNWLLNMGSNPTFATCIGNDGGDRYWTTAVEVLGTETRSFMYRSPYFISPLSVIGPEPQYEPDIGLNAISGEGRSIGSMTAGIGVISTRNAETLQLVYPNDAVLNGIELQGEQYGGASVVTEGTPMVATVFGRYGQVLYWDDAPGHMNDIESNFAVGQREGYAAYWRKKLNGEWQWNYVRNTLGQPIVGELMAIDHQQAGIGAGQILNGVPVVVDLFDGGWINLENKLQLPQGTLYQVVGVTFDPTKRLVSMAVEGWDFVGWAVAARINSLPGPGAWLGVALLAAGFLGASLGRPGSRIALRGISSSASSCGRTAQSSLRRGPFKFLS
jgi:hypothetical protein